jgi:hAT family C-terminal dimerisation region
VDFSEWCDISENVGFDSEIALYIHRPCVPGETDDLFLLWKQHQRGFPNLSKLAKKYLNIPASSASSERNFSAAGLVLSERRTRLSPENVD